MGRSILMFIRHWYAALIKGRYLRRSVFLMPRMSKFYFVVLKLILIAGLSAAIAALSVKKGWQQAIVDSSAIAYFFINYDDGFIRRGFIGHLFHFFYSGTETPERLNAGLWFYNCLILIFISALLIWTCIISVKRNSLLIALLFFVFSASQFLPTVAYNAGFLDLYDYVILLSCAIAFVLQLPLIAGFLGAIGPLVHEAYIFLWAPLGLLVLIEKVDAKRLTAVSLPIIATLLVYFYSSETAGLAQADRIPISDAEKYRFGVYQFGQSIVSSLHILIWKIANNFLNFISALLFFGSPTILMIVAFSWSYASWRYALILGFCALLPLLVLLVAWDLSRFIVGSIFTTLLGILYIESHSAARLARRSAYYVLMVASFLLTQIPFVFAYYEVAWIADKRLAHTPIISYSLVDRATLNFTRYFSRHIGPGKIVSEGHENPPGDVWYVEEDGWLGAWIRRPGTNLFDATATKGTDVITAVLRVTMAGDSVIAVRTSASDGSKPMAYVGTLRHNRIRGTYPGGVWSAVIRR